MKERGITLIALVVTIIVLLVLAGISISMLTGENGILNRAGEAKTKTEEAQGEQQKILSDYEQEIEDMVGNISQVDDAEPGKLEEVNGEYIISSIEDLIAFSYEVTNGENSYEGKIVKLGCNLDFKSKKSYVNPDRTDYDAYGYNGNLREILTSTGFNGIDGFLGTFDGNGYSIKNLKIEKEVNDFSFFGLFNTNKGIIKNLNVDDCNIEATGSTNYGFFGGICGNNSGKIYNCKVTGTIKSDYSNSILGGIAGYSENEIKNCINYAEISGKATQCGGVVGQHATGIISQCGNYGDIILTDANYIGGVIGLGLAINEERNEC